MTSSYAVLISGSGKRLGKHIAEQLAGAGCDLVLHYRTSAAAAEALAASLIAQYGVRVTTLAADFNTPVDCAALLQTASADLGRPINALVNNASCFDHDFLSTTSLDDLERHHRINVFLPVLLTQALANSAIKSGVVINLLDQKIANLNPDHFSYTLSKLALTENTRYMAQILAERGIRVNGVAPGISLPAPGQSAEEFAKAHKIAALGRSSQPGDIAAAVQFLLLSPAITGQVLLVDGGQHVTPMARDVSQLVKQL